MAISHVRSSIPNAIQRVHVLSDGAAAQFRSRFLFALMTEIHKDVDLFWHYNEAHHGKGPMDGIGGTIKGKVFRRVLSKDIVINTPQEFAEFANSICNVDCLYLPEDDLFVEPDYIKEVTPIAETLRTHKVERNFSKQGVPYNKFYYISNDEEAHFKQWYGRACGHAENDVDDNTCAFCLKSYQKNETLEWIQCTICLKWFHEASCFYE